MNKDSNTICGWHLPENNTNREQYEEDLARKRKEHLDRVFKRGNQNWRPCMHDSCPNCFGTGIKADGSPCVHMISCPCPKCSPSYIVVSAVKS